MTNEEAATEVLEHSQDAEEWDAEPAHLESRATGNQVVSVRLPTDLAKRLFDEAARLDVRASELVRDAVERLLNSGDAVTVVRAAGGAPGLPFRIFTPTFEYRAENANLVLNSDEPMNIVALGFEESA